LREQLAALVAIVIGRDFDAPWPLLVIRTGQVGEAHADGGRDLLSRAAGGVALQQRLTVVRDADRERALVLVVVRRTERQPAGARTLDTAEPLEDRGFHAHAGHSTIGVVGMPSQNTSTTCVTPLGLVPTK
jgi:hypothetical protein